MSSVLNQNVSNSNRWEGSNNTGQEFNGIFPNSIHPFPEKVVLNIFSRLNLADLGSVSRVSTQWNRLANEPSLLKEVIYRDIAFGNDKWAQYFGIDVVKDEDKNEEFSTFPHREYIADCKKFKKIFPERKAKDCLMLVRLPKTLNGGLTLNSLSELAKKYFPVNDQGYRFIWSAIIENQGDKSINKSKWVLMTKDVLPGSRDKSYSDQHKIVADLAKKSLINYQVPDTLEAIACILSQYIDSNTRLLSDEPWTYTRCKELVRGEQVAVGGFALSGLNVCSHYDDDDVGVAALRRF